MFTDFQSYILRIICIHEKFLMQLYHVILERLGNYTDRQNYGFYNLDENLEPITYGWITSPTKNKILSKTWFILQRTGHFRRFSTRVLQHSLVNTVTRAMVCDVYFPFPKILELY